MSIVCIMEERTSIKGYIGILLGIIVATALVLNIIQYFAS